MALSIPHRLGDLSSQRLRYESLSRKLFSLPRHLRQPALVPVGPRLFLRGELVDPGRVTVLLGEGWFAETSATQAQGIVQRRLAAVDEAEREEGVAGQLDEGEAVRGEAVLEEILSQKDAQVEVRPRVRKGAKMEENGKVEEGIVSDTTVERVLKAVVEKMADGSNARKRVTFAEPIVTGVLPPLPGEEKRRSKGKGKGKKKASASAPKVSMRRIGSKHATRAEFLEALRNAHQQTTHDGVVSFAEVYEGDVLTTEFPEGFAPDEGISFEDGSDEFLDLTRTKKGELQIDQGEEVSSGLEEKEDFLAALLEAEREAEAEEGEAAASVVAAARKKAEEKKAAKKAISSNEHNFGAGFNKGFLGAPPIKKRTSSSNITASHANPEQTIVDIPSEEVQSPHIVESPSELADIERVVERRGPRETRRKRRPGASSILAMRGMPAPVYVPQDRLAEEPSVTEVLGEEEEAPQVSKFRQMRNMQR